MGISSGGHQAMLAAMRPRDPHYSALPLPANAAAVDATIRCVVMCWPVIDPLGRYRYAKKLKAGGRVDLRLFEGEGEGFMNKNPGSPAATEAVEAIIEFVHNETR